jgi:hypothetical protein
MISIEEYKEKMQQKYKDELKKIDDELFFVDSWSRGELLSFILLWEDIQKELKYYIFSDWWTSIDAHHEEFEGSDIRTWLIDANVDILSYINGNLKTNSKGYIQVYRGHNEFNQGWDGLSWTTDKEVAKKFANGCGVRQPTKHPVILTGEVNINDILAIMEERQENEILCDLVKPIK